MTWLATRVSASARMPMPARTFTSTRWPVALEACREHERRQAPTAKDKVTRTKDKAIGKGQSKERRSVLALALSSCLVLTTLSFGLLRKVVFKDYGCSDAVHGLPAFLVAARGGTLAGRKIAATPD